MHLFQSEAEFQFQKILVVEEYLEAYEHCTDRLEIARLAQVIADIMVQRPRLNVEGSYFVDAYRNEVEVLKQRRELLREIKEVQIEIEKHENDEIRQFNELKFRKIQDHEAGKWEYIDDSPHEKAMSASEEEQHKKI